MKNKIKSEKKHWKYSCFPANGDRETTYNKHETGIPWKIVRFVAFWILKSSSFHVFNRKCWKYKIQMKKKINIFESDSVRWCVSETKRRPIWSCHQCEWVHSITNTCLTCSVRAISWISMIIFPLQIFFSFFFSLFCFLFFSFPHTKTHHTFCVWTDHRSQLKLS